MYIEIRIGKKKISARPLFGVELFFCNLVPQEGMPSTVLRALSPLLAKHFLPDIANLLNQEQLDSISSSVYTRDEGKPIPYSQNELIEAIGGHMTLIKLRKEKEKREFEAAKPEIEKAIMKAIEEARNAASNPVRAKTGKKTTRRKQSKSSPKKAGTSGNRRRNNTRSK